MDTHQDPATVVEAHGLTFTIRMSQTVVVAQVSAALEGVHLGAVGMVPGGFLGSTVREPATDAPADTDLWPSAQAWTEHVLSLHAPFLRSACGWACPTLHRAPFLA